MIKKHTDYHMVNYTCYYSDSHSLFTTHSIFPQRTQKYYSSQNMAVKMKCIF